MEKPHCELLHHGAAANSSPKVVACIPVGKEGEQIITHSPASNVEIVYASHLMLNVAKSRKISLESSASPTDDGNSSCHEETIWNVGQTLRTNTSLTQAEAETAAANVSTRTAKRVITCVAPLKHENENRTVLVCGFSDGSLTSWVRSNGDDTWEEYILLTPASTDGNSGEDEASVKDQTIRQEALAAMKGRSITDVGGHVVCGSTDGDDSENEEHLKISIVACSSGGAQYFLFSLTIKRNDNHGSQNGSSHRGMIIYTKRLIGTPSNTVKFHTIQSAIVANEPDCDGDSVATSLGIFLVGTAAPRHNKIHVFAMSPNNSDSSCSDVVTPKYSGALSGHEDWITCFDWTKPFSTCNPFVDREGYTSSCSYLASGSQDAKIRLWKWVTSITKIDLSDGNATNKETSTQIPETSSRDDDDDDDEEEVIEGEARLEIQYFDSVNNFQATTSIYLEALLIGHEEMVTSVAWHPNPNEIYAQDHILVSSSMDRSIFLWSTTMNGNITNSKNDGVWTPICRVGSPSGILGGPVGASLLGYLNVQIEPKFGRWIMGHAYGGALHFFTCDVSMLAQDLDTSKEKHMAIEERADHIKWKAQPCITGHFDEVTDLCWETSDGDYLITVSNDATCRIWAPLHESFDAWIEISRPQVHGYTLSAVTSLSSANHKHYLVTGADEKELRAFDGTNAFLRMLSLVSGSRGKTTTVLGVEDEVPRVDRAYMPSLGLSNKDSAVDGADEDTSGLSASNSLLPIEKDLGSTSLWPETRKLYGHNSEIVRVASTLSARTCLSLQFSTPYFDQVLVASTTKARDVNTATIRLWDVSNNRCLQTLEGGHRSTITALSFAPDGTYLASSGKDRRLCIWKRCANDRASDQNELFFLASAVNSSHKRIVWSVHFCPFDPSVLASASRDGTVKLWKIVETLVEGEVATTVHEYAKFSPNASSLTAATGSKEKLDAVTSLSFSPVKISTDGDSRRAVLAIGLENGLIQLWSVPLVAALGTNEVTAPFLSKAFHSHLCHIGAIKKLAWKPTREENGGASILASCSSDNGCRIFRVWL